MENNLRFSVVPASVVHEHPYYRMTGKETNAIIGTHFVEVLGFAIKDNVKNQMEFGFYTSEEAAQPFVDKLNTSRPQVPFMPKIKEKK
jgi:hypothetical protein